VEASMTEETPRPGTRRIVTGIALVSVSLLMAELILTRLFSVVLWYHFAFLAISIALFGTGAAALFVHLRQERLPPERTDELLARGCAALAASTAVAGLAILWLCPDLGPRTTFDVFSLVTLQLLLVFVAAAAPFFAGGFVLALALLRNRDRIHPLYAADLGGAALGCLLVVPILQWVGAPTGLALVGTLAALAGLPFAAGTPAPRRRRVLVEVGVAAALLGLLAAAGSASGLLRLHRGKGIDLDALAVESEQWNSFSLVTVVDGVPFRGWSLSPAYRGPIPEIKAVFIDLTALTPLVRFDGDLRRVRPVLWDLSSFVHLVHPGVDEACVIGAGAGRDVLAALAAGARRVTAVEINPLIVDGIVRSAYRDWAGGLYDRPDVRVVVDDGRAFLRATPERFDIVHLSMVDTSAATGAGAYALTENGLYTVEAFDGFLDRLRPGGLLSVSSITTPELDAGTRLAALARRAVERAGGDAGRSILVVSARWMGRQACTLHNVIVKRGTFEPAEIAAARLAAARLRFTVTWPPDATPAAAESRMIRELLGAPDADAAASLVASWPLDLGPPTDDRPFFFYQNRLGDAFRLLAVDRPAGYVSSGLFVLVRLVLVTVALVLVFLVLPFFFRRRELAAERGGIVGDLAYAGCLGLGFMFVEIAMLQRLALYLGRPTYALVVALFVLLLGGAAGSRLAGSTRLGPPRRRMTIALGGVVVLLVGGWMTGTADLVLDATAGWPAAGRVLLAAALLAPVGLFAGGALPLGLTAAGARVPTRVPWMWGINSAASVLGSVAATLVCLHAGISAALGIGAVLYAAALPLSVGVARPRPKNASPDRM
jgi:hypothetical protein